MQTSENTLNLVTPENLNVLATNLTPSNGRLKVGFESKETIITVYFRAPNHWPPLQPKSNAPGITAVRASR